MQTYPDGPFLQEEAMEIAKQLEKEELTDFTALNGCLEKWIQICDVREKDCVVKPMRFPQQQYNLGLNDYQSCARIMSHKTN